MTVVCVVTVVLLQMIFFRRDGPSRWTPRTRMLRTTRSSFSLLYVLCAPPANTASVFYWQLCSEKRKKPSDVWKMLPKRETRMLAKLLLRKLSALAKRSTRCIFLKSKLIPLFFTCVINYVSLYCTLEPISLFGWDEIRGYGRSLLASWDIAA